MLNDAAIVSSNGLELPDPVMHSERIYNMVKLGFSIADDDDDMPPLESGEKDMAESRAEEATVMEEVD